ncbi:acyltransferase family protein [Acetatifactor aquisgranensis]|uniref:acyltransferase family protein n=1 Tax=Acetatifactor aquisgranensis TaxID=2941233 RepID=UPI00204219B5|nr:acyltransferase [Acetatifactor aquisgranensis]
MQKRIDILGKGRGGVTLLIVLAHANLLIDRNLFQGVFIQGWCGVDFFFILSGFLMLWTYDRDMKPVAYIKKRLTRIYPVYWIYTGVVLTLHFFVVKVFGSRLVSWIELDARGIFRSFLCLPTDVAANEMPIIPTGWTLPYEMLYYFVALFIYICGIRFFGGIIACWVALIIAVNMGDFKNVYISFIGNPVFLEFFIGMLIACTVKQKKPNAVKKKAALVLGMIWLTVFWIAENREISVLMSFNRVFKFGVAFMLIVYGGVGMELSNGIQKRKEFCISRVLDFLEKISFSLYLVHFPLIVILNILGRKLSIPTTISFAVIIASCIVVGGCGYYFVEKPIMDYIHALQK